jgi:hypothetical protein
MPADGGYPLEDFLDAIASQLDRMQDSLRLKAVNRPLTYAVRDFSLDLNVFVDIDTEGRVRFRNSSPNESGASTVRVGFTTITRPMIEENTVELAMTKSPSLDEIGLDPEERRKLERVGVRNVAQLRRLGSSADTSAVARYAGVPIDRLRAALQAGRPRVTDAKPAPAAEPAPPTPAAEPRPAPAPRPAPEPVPKAEPAPVEPPAFRERREPPAADLPPTLEEKRERLRRRPGDGFRRPGAQGLGAAQPLPVAPGTRRLELAGENLAGPEPPAATLDGTPLRVVEAGDERIVVELPEGDPRGTLEVDLGAGDVVAYGLTAAIDDAWAPRGGR